MLGAVPASARSLRPASRAINDFNAARINAALSVKPLYSSAVRNRSSSSDTVALISPPCTNYSTYSSIKVVIIGQDCRASEIEEEADEGARGEVSCASAAVDEALAPRCMVSTPLMRQETAHEWAPVEDDKSRFKGGVLCHYGEDSHAGFDDCIAMIH